MHSLKRRLGILLSLMSILLGLSQHSLASYDPEAPPPRYDLSSVPPKVLEKYGPFGPQDQTYRVPRKAIFVAPDGKESWRGRSVNRPTSLRKAVTERARTGDVIVLRGGTYREGDLKFDKEITIQPYKDEIPVLKGSRVVTEWTKVGDLWVTPWEDFSFLRIPSWHLDWFGRFNFWRGDAVFFNGQILKPTDSKAELQEGEFFCDYENNQIFLFDNPHGHTIEIIAHRHGLVRTHSRSADPKGPTIRGLTLMHYGDSAIVIGGRAPNRPVQPGAMPRAPIETRIEHCRITLCALDGVYVVSPGAVIAYNEISYSAYVGMNIQTSHEAILEHNIIAGNSVWGNQGYSAGIKIFNQSSGFQVRRNLVENNPTNAIWYDVGHRDGLVSENFFRNNKLGVYVEISHKTTIRENIFKDSTEAGVKIHHSANCEIHANTFINSNLLFARENRGAENDNFGWHASSGPGRQNYHGHRAFNNVFAGESILEFTDSNEHDSSFQTSELSHLTFFYDKKRPLIAIEFRPDGHGRRAYESLEDFRQDYGPHESSSREVNASLEDIFISEEEGDFRLNPQYLQ